MVDRNWMICAAALGLATVVAMPAGQAQERAVHHRRVASQQVAHRVAVPTGPGQVRDLTINRSPLYPAPDSDADDDMYVDGAVRYNNIRSFDPAPYADSGRQYPFGLDGIGGYGSDLGFTAGHDSAVYDRGP